MENKYTKKLSLLTLCGAFAASASFGLTGEGDPVPFEQQQQQRSADADSPQAQFEAAQAELQQIAAALNPIQQEAQAQPEVQEALLSYDAALVEEMKSISPDQSEMIAQRGELFESLISAGDPAELGQEEVAEFQQNAQAFQQIRSELGETEMAAQNGEEVQQQLVEYQEIFMSAVESINPEAIQMIQRQEELHRTMVELQSQVMQN